VQRADVVRLRGEEQELMGKCKPRDDQIMGLKHEIGEIRGFHQKVVEEQTQHTRVTEEWLK
jgi:hypothetical protein